MTQSIETHKLYQLEEHKYLNKRNMVFYADGI